MAQIDGDPSDEHMMMLLFLLLEFSKPASSLRNYVYSQFSFPNHILQGNVTSAQILFPCNIFFFPVLQPFCVCVCVCRVSKSSSARSTTAFQKFKYERRWWRNERINTCPADIYSFLYQYMVAMVSVSHPISYVITCAHKVYIYIFT